MFESALPEVQFASVILLLLLPIVLFAPLRWAIPAWLIMGNLDATGPGQFVSSTTGWLNLVKSLVLPLILAGRMRGVLITVHKTLPARIWMFLTAYAALAIVWAPYPYAAMKLVGNMVGIFGTIVVLEQAARRGVLNTQTILLLILGTLGLAGFQTFYFGGATYGFDGPDQPSRLSSFIVAQQFAAYLVCFVTLILWRKEIPFWTRVITGSMVLGALALNGSRVWFFGAVIVVIAYFFVERARASLLIGFGVLASICFYLLVGTFQPYESEILEDSTNRIVATLRAIITGVDSSQRVGLRDLTFRTEIYQGVVNDLYTSSTTQLMFGHGTSSGAESVLRVFPNNYNPERLDPNRIVHNEWLRAAYEWGLVGLVGLAMVFVTLALGLNSLRKTFPHHAGATAALSFLGAFLLAFSGENVLAGAGNAVTMSLALILAFIWAPTSTPIASR